MGENTYPMKEVQRNLRVRAGRGRGEAAGPRSRERSRERLFLPPFQLVGLECIYFEGSGLNVEEGISRALPVPLCEPRGPCAAHTLEAVGTRVPC